VQIIQKLYPLPGRPDFLLELLPRLLEEAQIFGARHVTGQQTQPYLLVLERYGERCSSITLSLKGANAATHDALHNKTGAFERVLDTAR
jgi:MoaA/NifB/PqqE/SkfB family radical SAM enzyme